jgi:uncharacterized protein YjbI with pentapeptide repeats
MNSEEQPSIVLDELARWVGLHELWLKSQEKEGRRLVLRNAIVRGAALSERRLARAELVGVTLDAVTLADSQLGGVTLEDVRFTNCDLTEARMSWSRITNSSFSKCVCKSMVMGGAEVHGLEIQESDFSGSNLSKAVLRHSALRAVAFVGANLAKVVVEDSDLRACNFALADLTKMHVYRSDLRNSSFADALVDKMLLVDVKLGGASGVPREYGTMSIDGVDLSESGDGSQTLGREFVERLIAHMRAGA